MMSPYEGERIFEAEMVRLHQCDRNFYACAQQTAQDERPSSSMWGWLAGMLPGSSRNASRQPLAPSPKLDSTPSSKR